MLELALWPLGAGTKPALLSTSAFEQALSPAAQGPAAKNGDAAAEAASVAPPSSEAVDIEAGAPGALTAQDVRDVGRTHLDGVCAALGVPVGRAARAALLRALAALLPPGCAPGVLARRHVEPMDARLLAQALGQARCRPIDAALQAWCPTYSGS